MIDAHDQCLLASQKNINTERPSHTPSFPSWRMNRNVRKPNVFRCGNAWDAVPKPVMLTLNFWYAAKKSAAAMKAGNVMTAVLLPYASHTLMKITTENGAKK